MTPADDPDIAEAEERVRLLRLLLRDEATIREKAERERDALRVRLQNIKVQIIQIHAQDNYDAAGSMFEALVKELIERPEPSSMSDYFQGFVADKSHPLMSATGSEGRCELCGLRESPLHDAYNASKSPEIDAAIKRAYERAVAETAGAMVKEATDRMEHMVETGTRLPLNMECVAQVFGGKLHWISAAPILADGAKLYAFRKP